MKELFGFLFDLHILGEEVQLWIKTPLKTLDFYDYFYPEIYVRGKTKTTQNFIAELIKKGALHKKVEIAFCRDFYQNQELPFFKLTLSSADYLREIKEKLFIFYGQMEIYHADFEATIAYQLQKKIFPLSWVRVVYEEKEKRRILAIESQDKIEDLEYKIPSLKVLRLAKEKAVRLPLSKENALLCSLGVFGNDKDNSNFEIKIPFSLPSAIKKLNEILQDWDPDIVLTTQGDLFLLPELFAFAKSCHLPLFLDRPSQMPILRRNKKGGKSFNSYGNIVFRALAWPLYGRWHIDSANSFLYKEADLWGILELSRLSRLPVQRMARASTGLALTAIESETALKRNYVIPWQKSEAENPKTLLELLLHDKGGLIFMPLGKTLFSPAIQLDFSQMYPTIMVKHNISPETVNCACCKDEGIKVPGTKYHICARRRGVVSEALEKILERRAYLKEKKSQAKEKGDFFQLEIYEKRQSSLKWMLVTSFGYLGYRNAKFGKLESHETVTAYGREKLLQTKELAESMGFEVLHAMTDCLFLFHSKAKDEETLQRLSIPLCQKAEEFTGIKLVVEALFSWLCFPASRLRPSLGVPTHYFGRLFNGEMKYRGVALRRKDIPVFFREFQEEILKLMSTCTTVAEVKQKEKEFWELLKERESLLIKGKVSWQKLLFRRSVGKPLKEYVVASESQQVLEELYREGFKIQPGEKIRYLICGSKEKPVYVSEEKLYSQKKINYSVEKYLEILHRVFCELCEPFFSCQRQKEFTFYDYSTLR